MAETNTVNIADVLENQDTTWFATSTFLLCCLVMLADGFDNQAINYAAPSIIEEWGINRALMTPVFNISIVGWMTGSIGFAMLADRIGRRPSTVLAVLLFGAFTLAIPLATNLVELSILRFCAAFGVGGGMPMAIALVSDYAKSKSRGLRITLLYLGYTAGSSGGGILAAEILPRYGWRSVFYVGGMAALALAAILLMGLPESVRYLVLRRPNDRRILGYAQKLKPNAGFGGGISFTIDETISEGVPLKHLFTEGRAAMTIFLWFALGFAFVTHFFLSQWLTTLLTPELGFANAARTQALFQAGAALAFIFGFLIDKKGVRVTTLAMILATLPVAAIGVVADVGVPITMAMSLASGILVLGGDIGLSAIPSMIYPTSIRSTATGAAFGVARIGAILGPMIAGFLIYLGTPLDRIFILGALPLLAAGAASFMLDKSITPESAREMAARSALARH
jgi:AAHS family 4-hydroxybenzoate transporter-like MFS transporter